jgi:hypothetical protein
MEVVQWLDYVVESRSEINLCVKTLVPVAKNARREECAGNGNEAAERECQLGRGRLILCFAAKATSRSLIQPDHARWQIICHSDIITVRCRLLLALAD